MPNNTIKTDETIYFGNHGKFNVKFEKQRGFVETVVKLEDSSFVISYEEKADFLKDLKALIDKYYL